MNRAVLAGGAAGAALALAIWPLARASLDRYDASRFAEAETRATTVAADALPDAGFRLAAGSARRALAMTAAHVRKGAGAGGVLVERLAAATPAGPGLARIEPGLARIEIVLSGPEKAVLTLADAVERDMTGVRFRRWRATGLANGGVRLTGELAVAWK